MDEYPFFFTWVKQKNPLRFSIASVDGVKIYTETGHELIDMSSISYRQVLDIITRLLSVI